MKTPRFSLLVTLILVMSYLLTACAGGAVVNSWPGASADETLVYVSYQGRVLAVNASNGTLTWQFPAEDPTPAKPFYAAPAVSEDLIVAGNYGKELFALDKSGKPIWEGPFTTTAGNFAATPLIVGDTILAPASDDNLYAVDRTGKQLWKFKTRNVLLAQPSSDGEVVYLPAMDHRLYALNISDGSLVWEADLGSALTSAAILDGEMLYLGTMGGEVVAVNTSDGSVAWRKEVGGEIWATPVLGEDTLFVGNRSNDDTASKVIALSTTDGAVIWQLDTEAPVIGGGVLLPDGVAFPLENGKLVAYALAGGNTLWTQTINGKLYSTPVVAGNNVVVPVTQNEQNQLLQAVGLNGQISWPFTAPK